MKINAIGHLVKTNPIRQACVVCEGVAGLIKPNFKIPQSYQGSGEKRVSGTFSVSQLPETIFKVAFSRIFL